MNKGQIKRLKKEQREADKKLEKEEQKKKKEGLKNRLIDINRSSRYVRTKKGLKDISSLGLPILVKRS